MPAEVKRRRFTPPWSVEESIACYVGAAAGYDRNRINAATTMMIATATVT